MEQMRSQGKRALAGAEVTQSRLIEKHRLKLLQLGFLFKRDLAHEFELQLAKVEEQHTTELSSFPEYIKHLITAEKLGHVSEHLACVDIISARDRHLPCEELDAWSPAQRDRKVVLHLNAILLNSQSPWAEKFMSHNLMGRTSGRSKSCGRIGRLRLRWRWARMRCVRCWCRC